MAGRADDQTWDRDHGNNSPSIRRLSFPLTLNYQFLLMAIIFHITKRTSWDEARASGTYRPEMFPVDGFIHCSTLEQVIQVAHARFRGQTGLVLLSIDTNKASAEIVYENLEGGQQLFPHIYGALNIDAVIDVATFEPGADGCFIFPDVSEARA
jgi:uncharacterized protein (DUF952 family)